MCVLALAWKATPRWCLVVAGNRDEAHARPTAALAAWGGAGGVVAGRDLLSGGTWLGVAQNQRFAVVTNLGGHGPPAPDRPSRGQLLRDFLVGDGPFRNPRDVDLAPLNPFSLITIDGEEAIFTVNRPNVHRRALSAGLYGLSNGDLDEPWPKTLALKSVLAGWLEGPSPEPETLFDALRLETLPGRSSSPSGGPGGPVFIRNPIYGTRCSTVVAIDNWGSGVILERRFDPEGGQTGETRLTFDARPPR